MSTEFPNGRSYFALAAGFIAFAAYASLLPFDLRWVSPQTASEQFRGIILVPPARISRSDVLANTLLFVPIGFTLAGSLLVDRWSRLRSATIALPVLLASLTVSITIEYLQVYAPDRVPSLVDIGAQTIGCGIGMIVWAAGGEALTRWVRTASASARTDRPRHLLAGYVGAWLFVSLAPFDITLDVADLAERVRSGEIAIIPFGGDERSVTARIWDAVAETTSAIPLGAFGVAAFTRYRGRGVLPAFAVGASLVWLMEVAQVFIGSHAADSTDAIFGCVGVALGVLVSRRLLPSTDRVAAARATGDIFWWAVAGVVAASMLAVFYHWQPFDFAVSDEMIRRKLGRLSLLPFAAYRSGSYLSTLNDLLTKISLSLPIGVSAAFVSPRYSARRVFAVVCLAAAALLFAMIEGGQFFLATRIPDPTDVLVGVGGVYAGLRLARWLQSARNA